MVQETAVQLHIKGIREGLLLTAERLTFADLMAQLAQVMPEKEAFLRGSSITLQVGNMALDRAQLGQLKQALAEWELELWAVLSDREATRTAARSMGLGTRLAGSQTDLSGNYRAAPEETATARRDRPTTDPEPNGLVIKETLRSGRSIYTPGSIVVIGDVNPGAELIAGGDVIVWGRLRGLVHAGAHGDTTAVICALSLTPTQLRIADQIAISPDDKGKTAVAEQAFIHNGHIEAQPWHT